MKMTRKNCQGGKTVLGKHCRRKTALRKHCESIRPTVIIVGVKQPLENIKGVKQFLKL